MATYDKTVLMRAVIGQVLTRMEVGEVIAFDAFARRVVKGMGCKLSKKRDQAIHANLEANNGIIFRWRGGKIERINQNGRLAI